MIDDVVDLEIDNGAHGDDSRVVVSECNTRDKNSATANNTFALTRIEKYMNWSTVICGNQKNEDENNELHLEKLLAKSRDSDGHGGC